MRAITLSTLFHLSIVLATILFVNYTADLVIDSPIEITELLNAIRSQPKVLPKKAPSPKAQDTLSTKATTAPLPPSNSSASSDAPLGETTAEEYEVSSLPVLMTEVRIAYPPEARAQKLQGAVVFKLTVGSDGRVVSAVPLKSPAETLTQAALAAVKQFRFKPAILKDKPVAIQISYTYRFVLE